MSHDTNQELNPNMILMMTIILVAAAIGTVSLIVVASEAKTQAAVAE